MREKLQTLPVAVLKDMAKKQGIKGATALRKAELIEVLCKAAGETADAGKPEAKAASPEMADKKPENGNAAPELVAGRQAAGIAAPEPVAGRQAAGNAAPEPATGRQAAETAAPEAAPEGRSRKPETGYVPRTSGPRQGAPRRSLSAPGERRTMVRRDNRDNNRDSREGREGGYSYGGPRREYTQPRSYVQKNAVNSGDGTVSQASSWTPQSASQNVPQNPNPQSMSGYSQNAFQNPQNTGSQTAYPGQAPNHEQAAPAYQNPSGQNLSYTNREDTAERQDEMDSGVPASGILEVMPDGFGFIRCENFLPGENDVYVSPTQIRRFNLKTGDIISGNRRVKTSNEKFAALLYIRNVNGYPVSVLEHRPNFEDLTPIFPNSRLHMETQGRSSTAMRVLDLLAPVGKGQRGMIVSPPKAGKTTLLKQVAQAVTTNHPDMHMIILLIDERPEEVTDIKESVVGENVEVIYSTFDELPDRHKRVSEMVIERAKRLVEHGRDVIILLDSITRLARAYNLVVPPSGRTLSGGLDPAALHMPKRFFGAARNMREGGSLTILATALVDTGSRMDDVIYEEFKGTGNMELVLDRKLSEKRIFPAIDILKSGTRRDDLLLSRDEAEAVDIVRKATSGLKPEDSVERILDLFAQTRTNREFVEVAKKRRMF